jgi:hypothetical protein
MWVIIIENIDYKQFRVKNPKYPDFIKIIYKIYGGT